MRFFKRDLTHNNEIGESYMYNQYKSKLIQLFSLNIIQMLYLFII